MVLELHVWGPAFGLPSIDAECLATISYLNRAVPSGQWTLIADYDVALSPRHEFPLLIDNDNRITGFPDIVAFLKDRSYDIDLHLTQDQRTDRTAYLSFLKSLGGSLIDLSLYVSAENYHASVSSAYTAILPWYLNYTIPPSRRDQARARTAHLGLGSLDITAVQKDDSIPGGRSMNSDFEAAKREAGVQAQPSWMGMVPKGPVGRLLKSPIYAARFKLDALANELLEPLVGLLGKKDYLLGGDTPSSLDCACFAYLALMLYPPVPQAWLKEALDGRFSRLRDYVERMRKELLQGEDVNAADIWALSSKKDDFEIQSSVHQLGLHLPWRPRRSRRLHVALAKTVLEITGRLPLVSTIQNRAVIQDNHLQSLTTIRSSLPSPLALNLLFGMTGAVTAVVIALAVRHRRSPRDGPLIFWALRPQPVGFGEAGEFLNIFANQLLV